jgi:hypothetical protein
VTALWLRGNGPGDGCVEAAGFVSSLAASMFALGSDNRKLAFERFNICVTVGPYRRSVF